MSRHDIETFDQKKFAAEIRAFMKKHKLTTREFAEVTDFPHASFRRIERGDHGLRIETAQNLLKSMKNFKAVS